jgi:hypothetical protein
MLIHDFFTVGDGLSANATRCFEGMVNDPCSMVRVAQRLKGQPGVAILDCRKLQSSCNSGPCTTYDGYKQKRGSKVHMAMNTLGQ